MDKRFEKRAYTQPTLTSYGSIAKLTQVGLSGDGGGTLISIDIDLSGLGL